MQFFRLTIFMKYIVRKVIKGRSYYYFQYQDHTKLVGDSLPTNLDQLKKNFGQFFKDIAKKEYFQLPDAVRQEFRFGDLNTLETLHYSHVLLYHDLFKKEFDNFYEEFIKLFTYHSNKSEGSKTTKKAIDRFASRRIRVPRTKTEKEIFNSFLAFNFAFSKEMKWNMKSIKHIHALLLNGLDPIIAGQWKKEDNVAPGNQPTISHKGVSAAMKALIAWLKAEFRKKTMYPPKLALHFYVKFEAIHPFLDGNGRVGRILLNALLKKFNYPPIIFFSENHQQHSSSIQKALEGRWDKMNKHFLEQVKKTDHAL